MTVKRICYEVFNQDSKDTVRTYSEKEDAENYCNKINSESSDNGGSSTQYGVDEVVKPRGKVIDSQNAEGEHEMRKVCPNCGMAWEADADSFGCWVCGHEYENEDTEK